MNLNFSQPFVKRKENIKQQDKIKAERLRLAIDKYYEYQEL